MHETLTHRVETPESASHENELHEAPPPGSESPERVPPEPAEPPSEEAFEGTAGFNRRAITVVGILFLLLAVALVTAGVWLRGTLHDSLPQLEGEAVVAGLSSPVRIERDALGVPVIRGANRLDVARATGFLHAQERFFQMDMLRRRPAAETAALLGEPGLHLDETMVLHGFRERARRAWTSISEDERELIRAYTGGVNAGLGALDAPPFEYVVLRQEPTPWREEDTLLVIYAMYTFLQDYGTVYESGLGLLHDSLTPQLFEFLVPRSTRWDVPIAGEPPPPAPLPGPEVIDLRRGGTSAASLSRDEWALSPPLVAGSNAWLVNGARSTDGVAILASDIHMGLGVPNMWYRATFRWTDDAGRDHQVSGITLPGVPNMVAGSNGTLAWSYTNSLTDAIDLAVIDADPETAATYPTPDGPRPFERRTARLEVRGGEPRVVEVISTIWGPIFRRDHRGRPRAMRWVAHQDDAVNLVSFQLETADTIDRALEVAQRSGLPAQNFLVAHANGEVAWSIIGYLPDREGFSGRLPGSWQTGERRWLGRLPPEEYPVVRNPDSGLLWSANNRHVTGEDLEVLGDGGYWPAARARQIRDRLFALESADEADLLAIQLDVEARFFFPWRDLALALLTEKNVAGNPLRQQYRELVSAWDGYATADSVGYRLVRAFRLVASERVLLPLVDHLSDDLEPPFDYYSVVLESDEPLWRLVEERPLHFLPPEFATWEELLLASIDEGIGRLLVYGGTLADRAWGELNRAAIHHPFSEAVPLLGPWLDMPADPLPGDLFLPRLQEPSSGASERMVVSPGREEEAIFHMPGGQSAHPLSPHYRAGHSAWVRGEATPLLPGPPEHVLELVPRS